MKVLIVIPVYNEEKIIINNLKQLFQYLEENLADYDYQVVIADNVSTDQTALLVKNLSATLANLEYLYISQKASKGAAVIKAWQKYQNDFDVFCFMDADLATDLEALLPLVKAIEYDGYDLAIGSRYLKDSKVKRTFSRKIFSLTYRLFLKIFLGTKIKDFPCGFKAVNQKIVKEIIPQIKNQTWFFDSEMLYLAEKAGYKIKEI